MTTTQPQTLSTQTLTFQEYFLYQGDPDVMYELFRGRLISRSTPTARPSSICTFLVYQLQQYIAAQNLDLIARLDYRPKKAAGVGDEQSGRAA